MSGVLAWTAGEMIVADKIISPYLHRVTFGELAVPVVLTAIVILIGRRVRGGVKAASS